MKKVTSVVFLWAALAAAQDSPAARAVRAARTAVEKQPQKAENYSALALAYSRLARETADDSNYDKAAEAVDAALKLTPDDFEALKMRTWVLLGKHEFAEALELAKTLNRRMPDDAAVYGFLTDAHTQLGNYPEAEEAAQWMLNVGRSSVPGMTRAAFLRELFGDIDGALELMNLSFQRIEPSQVEDRAWVLTQIGQLLRLQGKFAEASRVLDAALDHMPDYHYALAGKAKVRLAEGRFAEAASLFERRYRAAPHPENLFEYAAAVQKAGKTKQAQGLFRQFEKEALAESAGWDNANRELIAYYADYAMKPAAALTIAKREIARRRDVHTLDAYAWALHKSGMYAEASKQIDKALAVGTVDPDILRHARAIRRAAKPRRGNQGRTVSARTPAKAEPKSKRS
jgi:tetratricopeptide (TPR) repeat protein